MSQANVAPSKTTRTDPKIGHVVEDQRSGDARLIIYVDSRVVLTRDEDGNTTLSPRDAFVSSLGSRYRLRTDIDPDVDGGQYDKLRTRLAEYEAAEGRKAAHKTAALEEALDLLADRSTQWSVDDDNDADRMKEDREQEDDPEIPFEEVPGIGPETAGKLRAQGYLTETDLRRASDEAVLAVAGVGPSNLANLREFLE